MSIDLIKHQQLWQYEYAKIANIGGNCQFSNHCGFSLDIHLFVFIVSDDKDMSIIILLYYR